MMVYWTIPVLVSILILGSFGLTQQASSQVCTPAPSGLVSWWTGDTDASDIQDGNNGVLTNGATAGVAGKVAGAFSFDGINDIVKIPASTNLDVGTSSGFTIDMWINPSDVSSSQALMEYNSGSAIGVLFFMSVFNPPASLYADLIDTSNSNHLFESASNVLTANTFQHVALTYDKTTGIATLYKDGGIVAQQNLGIFTPQTSFDLNLGQRFVSPTIPGTNSYSGLMDEVGIYNRALSQSEIQAIFNADSAGKCTDGIPFNPTPIVLHDPTPTASTFFGIGVSTNGQQVLVGTGTSSGSGEAYLYDDAGALLLPLDNSPFAGGALFGFDVDLDLNGIIVGVPHDNTLGSSFGSVNLFDIDGADAGIINNPNPTSAPNTDNFGIQVARDGGYVLVGASNEDIPSGFDSGLAYLYATDGSLVQTFQNPTVFSKDGFGARVVIDGDNIAISATSHNKQNGNVDLGNGASNDGIGEVYLFNPSSATSIRTIPNPAQIPRDFFGTGLDIDGNNLVVGSPGGFDSNALGIHDTQPGVAYLFDYSNGDLVTTFDNPSPSSLEHFGQSVSIDGDRVLVGSRYDDLSGDKTGAAYLFDLSGNLLQSFPNPNPNSDDLFGEDVLIRGDLIVIGARADDADGTDAGVAYLYTSSSSPLVCPIGQFAASGDLVCTDAPAGSFVDTTGATSATQCATGTFQALTGQSQCDDSPAGSFVDTTGATSATQCATGTFQALTGQSSCTDADVGNFVSIQGSSSQTACPADTYQPLTGQSQCESDLPLLSTTTLDPTNSDSATFSFSAVPGAGFECSIDASPFLICSSPDSHSGLTDGEHIFAVKATDTAGNSSPASTFEWTIDLIAPVITLNGDSPLILLEGETYVEDGATITDNSGEDLSGSLIIDSSGVNTSTAGTYPVTYDVTDSVGNPAIQVIRTVIVQSPQEANQDLIEDIEDLVDAGTLNNGQGNSMTSKLNNIINKLNNGQTTPACNQLNAFINQVNDFIINETLTPTEGQALIDLAERVQDSAGC